MEVLFKINKSIIKMKDRIDAEGVYITTSTINEEKKTILKKCASAEEAKELLENIFLSIEKGIKEEKKIVSIIL